MALWPKQRARLLSVRQPLAWRAFWHGTNIIEFPTAEPPTELAETRASLLAVRDDRDAMKRVVLLAERVADIIGEIDEISVQDRISLQWHVSLIRELAVKREGGITPGVLVPAL